MKLSKNRASQREAITYHTVTGTVHPLGGDDRDRTGDLWLAKPPLSQLSYIPLRPIRNQWA